MTKINPYIVKRRLIPVSPSFPTEAEKAVKALKGAYFMGVLQISRPPKCIPLTVLTTPTLIAEPPHEWPYLVLNPSLAVGLTTSYVLFSGNVVGAGNTQLSPLGVANYMQCHFHLNVTVVAGIWDIYAQTRDPNTGNWADSQVIFGGIAAPGTFYATVGNLGVAVDFAIRWVPVAPGNMTFSITATLKEGVGGGPAGLSRAIFLGGRDVTVATGLPIFEGESMVVLPGPDIVLYAIANANIPIKVFTL